MGDPETSGREDVPAEGAVSGEAPGALAALEEQLSQEVPLLLESMNRTSAEVNMFEARAGEAQQRYQDLLAEWSQMYESLHAQFGSAIDRVKPYFDAAQVFAATSQRVQGAVREFSTASSLHARAKERLNELERSMEPGAHNVPLDGDMQEGLSRATVEVTRCQRERDRLEGEYAKVLREYQKSQEDLEAWRAHIGDTTIKRTLPCFRQLHQQQLKLASEQNRARASTPSATAPGPRRAPTAPPCASWTASAPPSTRRGETTPRPGRRPRRRRPAPGGPARRGPRRPPSRRTPQRRRRRWLRRSRASSARSARAARRGRRVLRRGRRRPPCRRRRTTGRSRERRRSLCGLDVVDVDHLGGL
ncbi:unnamed protein product [Prorocentrum cordatum]|uniref:Uncharacterized protein n=1 Tax=Prorocentrum cordatum TaxID=2364126 RepID=A0ABN9RQA4_9DINO|nr:unnamed protein product [Polarella glacialis]